MSSCSPVNSSEGIAPAVMACPVNAARSKRVDILTLRSLVRRLPLRMPPVQYYFCEAVDCDVVYFASDPQAPVFRRNDLWVRVGAKEKAGSALVCYCFGFSREEIADEVRKTGKSAIFERVAAEVKAGNCACEVKNPSGKCCLGEIQNISRSVRGAR